MCQVTIWLGGDIIMEGFPGSGSEAVQKFHTPIYRLGITHAVIFACRSPWEVTVIFIQF
jgi:hypothetical protein